VIEAFGTAIKVATFLIPASLGVLEGGFLATFVALGLSPTTAISFSLVRRAREVAWIAIGLVVFAVMRPRAPNAPESSSDPESHPGEGRSAPRC